MALRALRNRKDVRFERGTHDLRSFEVRTSDNDQTIGVVDDILVDDRGRSRYLCVDLKGKNRHVLVPAGAASSDQSKKTVYVSGVDQNRIGKLPAYDHDVSKVDADFERRVGSAFDGNGDPYARADYRGRGWGRGKQDGKRKIERVDELDDIRVAKDDPDPRGWDVHGHDGKKLGRITHLLGDTGTMRVVYMVMRVDSKLVDDTRDVLIPAGHSALDRNEERVQVNALDEKRVATLPKYKKGKLDREQESKIARIFDQGYSTERRYEHPRYADEALYGEERVERAEEELRVGKTKQPAGSVEVKKRVETERVQQPVKVHHEEVDVERRPASGHAKDAHIGEDEVRIPVTKEEVVVEKRPVVKEEIVVRKRDVEETETVDEKVRRERVDVERHGGA